MEDKFKNWKSTGAFFTFVLAYIYALVSLKAPGVIETAGYIALYSSTLMMVRSDKLTDIVTKLVDNMKAK